MQKAATVSSTCYQCHYRAAALTFLPISCFVLLLKHNELQFLFLDEYIMYFSNAQRCRWRPAGWDVAVPMNTNGVQQGGGGGGGGGGKGVKRGGGGGGTVLGHSMFEAV